MLEKIPLPDSYRFGGNREFYSLLSAKNPGVERLVVAALQKSWTVAAAAELLGVTYRALRFALSPKQPLGRSIRWKERRRRTALQAELLGLPPKPAAKKPLGMKVALDGRRIAAKVTPSAGAWQEVPLRSVPKRPEDSEAFTRPPRKSRTQKAAETRAKRREWRRKHGPSVPMPGSR